MMQFDAIGGDITEHQVDAIVNAANSSLLGGGGVDGAIHHRGGPEILAECRALRDSRYGKGDAASAAWDQAIGPVWAGSAGQPLTADSSSR
jgi:O-acetyl-ADP-ribose deacetylase (regulator of RNase III)